MTKNITVIDENGNTVGSTYQRRAYGLIKKGRAQRIGDNAIMLRASANENRNEAKFMANNIYEIFDNQVSKMQERLDNESEEQTTAVRIQILKSMEEFRRLEHEDKTAEIVREQLTAMQSAMKLDSAADPHERGKTRRAMIALMDKLVSGNSGEKAALHSDIAESPADEITV